VFPDGEGADEDVKLRDEARDGGHAHGRHLVAVGETLARNLTRKIGLNTTIIAMKMCILSYLKSIEVLKCQRVEERRFAGRRRAHHRHQLAAVDVTAHY
jgi:hypothetical protein